MTGLYEQIKTDLGYLQLTRAGEVFATLADDAKAHDWTHNEFLARLLDEEAAHTRNRRLAARPRYAKFPFRKTIDDFDLEFQPSVDRKLVAIGLYKTECIRTTVFHAGPYRTIGDVEYATAGWVDWYNNRRPHGTLDYLTPVEFVRRDWRWAAKAHR